MKSVDIVDHEKVSAAAASGIEQTIRDVLEEGKVETLQQAFDCATHILEEMKKELEERRVEYAQNSDLWGDDAWRVWSDDTSTILDLLAASALLARTLILGESMKRKVASEERADPRS